jgi:hypothetical protein
VKTSASCASSATGRAWHTWHFSRPNVSLQKRFRLRGFAQELAPATEERAELQAASRLWEARQQLKGEVGRLKKIAALKAARSTADTNAITQKSSALTREYATKVILDEFTRED